MKHLKIFLIALGFAAPAVYAIEPHDYPVTQARVDAVTQRVGAEIVQQVLRTINPASKDGPDNWSNAWVAAGQKIETSADKLISNDKPAALQNYFSAQSLYRIGYLPEYYSAPERNAYRHFANVMAKINPLLTKPYVIETVSYRGDGAIVHLYMPRKEEENPPLVLYTGGVDGSKESGWEAGQILTSKGIAVAAFDLVGTGENSQWKATPDSHDLHRTILDHFEKSGEFNFNKIGLIGRKQFR